MKESTPDLKPATNNKIKKKKSKNQKRRLKKSKTRLLKNNIDTSGDEYFSTNEYFEEEEVNYNLGYDDGYQAGFDAGVLESKEVVFYNDELLTHDHESLPKNIQKFWDRRYGLFTRYDDGIYLNEELWYSVTPESTAENIADHLQRIVPDARNVLDLCCGGGGNTIQFAKKFENVMAIDINATHIYCTRHNCQIYDVAERVWTLQADWNELTSTQPYDEGDYDWCPFEFKDKPFDFIFCSPPWGGTDYNRNTFDLYTMEPFPLPTLLRQCYKYTNNIALYLPKSSSSDQLDDATLEVFGASDLYTIEDIYDESETRLLAILVIWSGLP